MQLRLAALSFVAYLLGAVLAYAFALRPAGNVVVWVPAGILLGLLLVRPRKHWPIVLLGGMAGNAVADAWAGSAPTTIAIAALANGTEAAVAAWVVTTVAGGPPTFTRVRDVGALAVVACLLANMLTSIGGAWVLMHGSGMSFWRGWFVWFTGDSLGQLLLAPAVVLLIRRPHLPSTRWLEIAVTFGLLGFTSWLVVREIALLGGTFTANPYLVFPVLLWIAIRLGPAGAAAANVTLASVVLWFGSTASGFFGHPGASSTDQVLLAWSFLGTAGTTSLAVAAAMAQQRDKESLLQVSERRLRQIAENISEVFWICEVGLRKIHYISWAFERIWGRNADDFYARPGLVIESIHPDDRARALAVMGSVEDQPRPFAHEYRIVRPDGTVRWIADHGYPLPQVPGEPQQYVGIAQDITERHAALARAELLAQAVASSNDLVAVMDLSYRFTFVNAAFQTAYGYSEAEVLGQTPELTYVAEGSAAPLDVILAASAAEGWRGVVVNRRKDESHLTIALSTSPVRARTGERIGILVVGRDITERVRLETDLRQAQKMEAVGQLVGGVAHDFNNLLTIILGYTQLLSESDRREDSWKADIQEVHAAATRAAGLTRQLLAFGRKQPLQLRHVDLRETIADLLPMLRRLLGERVTISFTPGHAAATIHADPTQVEQILLNLCVNARDAMPGGGAIQIDVRAGAPGSPVTLVVADTGEGMDETTKRRIFEPFFTTKPAGRGTGLGLATIFGIVRSLDGSIVVDSAVGRGTTFTITLPGSSAAATSTAQTQRALSARGLERVLVVEDDASIREFLVIVLETYGYVVRSARSAEEALALLARPDLQVEALITDLLLPGRTGADLAQDVLRTRPNLRVLFISGYSEDTHGQKVSQLPGHFLAKPFDGPTLADCLRQLLDSSSVPPT